MKISILLVDDHAMLRTGLRNVLEAENRFKVLEEEAESGEEAIELVKKLEPQVVLMDLKMPGIGGLKAISNINYCQSRISKKERTLWIWRLTLVF